MNHFLVASVVCVDIEFYADNRLHSEVSIDHHSVVVNIAILRNSSIELYSLVDDHRQN